MRLSGVLFVIVLLTSCSEAPKEAEKAPERPPSNYFVSVKGTPEGNGSKESPWDLQTALAHPRNVLPGDLIWIRGGTYKGQFKGNLNGSQRKPIVVRAYQDERVIIDSPAEPVEDSVLRVDGSWTWYWGFEVTSSWPPRVDPPKPRPIGVNVFGHNNKLINLVVHDAQGVGFWGNFDGSEMYGNIVYYNGQDIKGQGSGNGIAAQNREGVKRLIDNISFQNFGNGMQMFGSDQAYLDGLYLEGNVVFNNGSISKSGEERNILLGGGRVAQKPTLISNFTYWSKSNTLAHNNVGYLAGCNDITVKNNYFAIGSALILINCRIAALEGNTFVGSTSGFDQKEYARNVYVPYGTKPDSGINVFVRANKYQPGRGHIVVYNWESKETVEAKLDEVLKPGQNFEIRDAQNYFGEPVLEGVYNGGPVTIPLKLTAVAKPVGVVPVPPVHTTQEFGVFVVQSVARPSTGPARTEPPAKTKRS
ncbi:MAG: hypothetical protein IT168_33090 [Bryobacterales bacterium]|nr:hypothetical protein [Bryobacterales bacterium]